MPTPTADTVPGVERAPGRKKTVGQKYVETLGVDEIARAAQSVVGISKIFDGTSGLGGVSADLSAVSKAFGASTAASDLVKQFSAATSIGEKYSKLSTGSALAKQAGLLSEATGSVAMIDAARFSANRSAALAGLSAMPRIDANLSAVSKAFGASTAASDLVKQFSAATSIGEKYSKLSTGSALAKQAGLLSEATRSVAMIDAARFSANRSAALAGLSAMPRIDANLSAVSKAFGASTAASDLVKQFSAATSIGEKYSKLSTGSALAKQAGLLSEATRSVAMIDAARFSANRSAALAGLSAMPRIDANLSAVSKAFGASTAASDLVKQFSAATSIGEKYSKLSTGSALAKQAGLIGEAVRAAGMVDAVGLSHSLAATHAWPSLFADLDSRPQTAESFVRPHPDQWEQNESGLWTRPNAEDFWAYLIAAVLTLRVMAWYYAEENRIGAPLSETNRAALLLEVGALWQVARFIESQVRSAYRWITGAEKPVDEQ